MKNQASSPTHNQRIAPSPIPTSETHQASSSTSQEIEPEPLSPKFALFLLIGIGLFLVALGEFTHNSYIADAVVVILLVKLARLLEICLLVGRRLERREGSSQ